MVIQVIDEKLNSRELAKKHEVETLRLLQLDPQQPYAQIAKEVGISRERVRQILKENDKHEKRHHREIIKSKCGICGKEIFSPFSERRKYCSPECRRQAMSKALSKHITVMCEECGRPFKKGRAEVLRTKHNFCNKKCYGMWFGKKYGTQKGERLHMNTKHNIEEIKYELVPISQVPVSGPSRSPQIIKLITALKKLENDKAIKAQMPDIATAQRIAASIRRGSKTSGFDVTTRIKSTDDGCLLYLLKIDKTS